MFLHVEGVLDASLEIQRLCQQFLCRFAFGYQVSGLRRLSELWDFFLIQQ